MRAQKQTDSPSGRRANSLTKRQIIDTALRQLREVGPDKLSLRAVARELGVTPMALYRHVSSKQALLDEVRQSVMELVPMVGDTPVAEEAPPERGLSDTDIIDTALTLVREGGVDALNMRKLAKRLGVTPMSIYRHVSNKEALLARMMDALAAKLDRPPSSPETWERDFRAYAKQTWELFSSYPGLIGSVVNRPSPGMLEHMSHERYLLSLGGFDSHTTSVAVTVYHTFMLGLYNTQSLLEFLQRLEGEHTGVKLERIRQYGEQLPLDELLDFALEAVLLTLRGRRGGEGEGRAFSSRGRA